MALRSFFIGSYTQFLTPEIVGSGDGIYTVQLNEETGEISVLHVQKTINPSYLTLSSDNKYLYCNTEVTEDNHPVVQAFKVNDDFSLHFLNEQPIPGGCPCHIEVLDNKVFVACYISGNVLEYPLDESGRLLNLTRNYRHRGSSINLKRQEAAHAHQVAVHPNQKDIYVCDLGIDTIKAYEVQIGEFCSNEPKDIEVEKGGGPRHMVFNKEGSLGYVINELSGMVSVIKNMGNKFEQIGSYSSLPNTYKDIPSASAIRIHPNGSYLYVANRNFDAITIFRIKGELLELLGYQQTNGKELRDFNISPNGNWLIACHQNSNDTIIYKVKPDGLLTQVYKTKAIKTPVCVTFLK